MKRFSKVILDFVFIVVLLSEFTKSQTVVTECDVSAAQEECMARGCDCWLTSKNVNYEDWLNACINKLCSYNQICSDYSCTFEECIEGNCDLEIDYTSVCEDYCKDECTLDGYTFDNFILSSMNGATNTYKNYFNILPSSFNQLIIEFDAYLNWAPASHGRWGGFWFGTGSNRLAFRDGTASVVEFRDSLNIPNAVRGWAFLGVNGCSEDTCSITKEDQIDPNGHWRIIINENRIAMFEFDGKIKFCNFNVRIPTNLSFWIYNSGVYMDVKNLRVSYK